MYKFYRLNDEKTEKYLFALCWLAYFSSYIGRLNYSSAMPAMIGSQVLTASQAGFISMLYFFAYGIGQMFNGFLGDRLHPGKMIFAGLFVSGAANILMGSTASFPVMAACWCANGYLQAMIWPPMMRIFAEMFQEERKVKCCVNITSTMALGTLASYLLSAVMLSISGWRAAFFAAAVWMCGAAVFFAGNFRKVEKRAAENGTFTNVKEPEKIRQKKQDSFWKLVAASGLAAVLAPVVIHGVLKDGVTTWVPTYISETFQASPQLSILVTTVLPVVNLTGAYAAQYMYRRFFKKNEVRTAAFFFGIATAALLLLWRFASTAILLTVLLLALITASMMAVNTLFVNLIPLRFEKTGKVSAVSGFMNSMAYLGTAVSTYTIGIFVEHLGWSATIFSWLVITAAAMGICIWKRKQRFEIE